MSEQKVKTWKEAQQTRKGAESWNNLPSGPKYQNDSFKISVQHCKAPVLMRAGQSHAGGQNYWETEKDFNKAILEWLVGNWSKVYPEVLEILKEKERKALKDCQEYVDTMQAMIDEAKVSEVP